MSGVGDFVWQLAEDGPGTRIDVHVGLPESEAHRLDDEREIITTSLARLATLAKWSPPEVRRGLRQPLNVLKYGKVARHLAVQ